MRIVEWLGLGVLIVLAALAALFVRRSMIARGGGTIELGVRLTTMVPGRGWSAGGSIGGWFRGGCGLWRLGFVRREVKVL